jgi:hypothetical protein
MRAEAMAAEKVVLAARAHELADRARAAALRADPAHAPFSRTRRVAAINPGKTARGGWITINARTLRVPVDALRDVETGEVLPLERVLAAEWAKPEGEDAPPFEVPDDVWPFVPQALRAYVPHVPPGGRRVFELVKTSPVVPVAALEGQTALWAWSFHRETGLPVKLVDLACGIDLVDRIAPFGFGQVVIERAEGGPGVRPRDALATRDPKKVAAVLKRSTPRVISAGMAPGVAGPRFVAAFEHEAVHRIEQVWDLAPGTGPGEGARAWVTTTLWLKEHHGPQAIYLSLPLALAHPKVFYDSVGHRTRVGADQIPGACGEYLAVNRGVEYETPAARVSVATPDTPLGMFDAIHARDGQTTFTPEGGHFYAMIQNTYWPTNFSHARGGKLTVRLGIGCGTTVDAMGELWAGPVT